MTYYIDICDVMLYNYNMGMKVKEIIKLLESDGWYLVTQRGSYRQYKHGVKIGRVTVAGKLSKDIPPGTLNSILKQAQIKEI